MIVTPAPEPPDPVRNFSPTIERHLDMAVSLYRAVCRLTSSRRAVAARSVAWWLLRIPVPNPLDREEQDLLQEAEMAFAQVGQAHASWLGQDCGSAHAAATTSIRELLDLVLNAISLRVHHESATPEDRIPLCRDADILAANIRASARALVNQVRKKAGDFSDWAKQVQKLVRVERVEALRWQYRQASQKAGRAAAAGADWQEEILATVRWIVGHEQLMLAMNAALPISQVTPQDALPAAPPPEGSKPRRRGRRPQNAQVIEHAMRLARAHPELQDKDLFRKCKARFRRHPLFNKTLTDNSFAAFCRALRRARCQR
jgi:hypothetical protein